MINLISTLRKSTFVKNVSTLSSGIIVAHLTTIVASLFITRIYTPESIGFITFFGSVSIVLANLFTMGFELAIVPSKDDLSAQRLASGSFYLLMSFSSLLFIITLVFQYMEFPIDIGIPSSWIIYLPISILFLGCINIGLEWFNYTQDYKLLSFVKIIQSVSTALPQILIGYYFLNKAGLLIGFLFGRFSAAFTFFKTFLPNTSLKGSNPREIKTTLISHKEYPKYIAPTLILDRLSMEVPYFLIPFLFSESILGYYAIAYRVLSVPLSFLGASIGQVFFKFLATRKHKNQKLTPYLIRTWLSLAAIGIIPMGIILFGGEPLFEFVFGKGWGLSGTLAILLVPMLYLDFISSPTGRVFLILNLEHYTPFFSGARLIYLSASLYIGFIYQSMALAILLMSLSRTCGLLIQNLILYKKSIQHDSK